jgi:hypothetical protein
MQISIGSSASSNCILAATGYLHNYNILDFEDFGNERYSIFLEAITTEYHGRSKKYFLFLF